MLSYELCKKLKDAGFSCAGREGSFEESGEVIQIPSLSELIEACGDCFIAKVDNVCTAGGGTMTKDDKNNHLWSHRAEGETLEIVVCNLWLKLNEKL